MLAPDEDEASMLSQVHLSLFTGSPQNDRAYSCVASQCWVLASAIYFSHSPGGTDSRGTVGAGHHSTSSSSLRSLLAFSQIHPRKPGDTCSVSRCKSSGEATYLLRKSLFALR